MRDLLLEAIKKRAKAKAAQKKAEIELLLDSPAAIGEHTVEHYIDDLYRAFEDYEESLAIQDMIGEFESK